MSAAETAQRTNLVRSVVTRQPTDLNTDRRMHASAHGLCCTIKTSALGFLQIQDCCDEVLMSLGHVVSLRDVASSVDT